MHYLFRNSNSINDFIDPVLPLVLGRSLPNETQKQAISRAWWGGRAVLSEGCPWERSDARPQLLCSLSAAASRLATTETLQLRRQQNAFSCSLISLTFIYLFWGGCKTLAEAFHAQPLLRVDDIRKYLCVISELRPNFWSKLQQNQCLKLELNVNLIQEIV